MTRRLESFNPLHNSLIIGMMHAYLNTHRDSRHDRCSSHIEKEVSIAAHRAIQQATLLAYRVSVNHTRVISRDIRSRDVKFIGRASAHCHFRSAATTSP